MKKLYIDYELDDATTGRVRVLAADKVRFESAARANGWPLADGPRSVCVMLYAALTRTGVLAETITYETFVNEVLIDYSTDASEDADPTN
ncbi:hypothetical protein HMPREF1317_0290 [Schaalia georgiae F0490]|jgi:hypothetical protein|uniref:Uncharacterized protein n=1 Tax=Schaalia georgiae F0490 TaxID=1125717 RepID=J0MNK7_9ACTO|nr:hypothetical protein [Schaalia georgiae]EJF35814.1 hypothetical protein HMPREF1317_0290 [Schaalia georgiae F0490]DAW00339.1 MAG TPA: hypothetical protein [Caudoviricetes sp.]